MAAGLRKGPRRLVIFVALPRVSVFRMYSPRNGTRLQVILSWSLLWKWMRAKTPARIWRSISIRRLKDRGFHGGTQRRVGGQAVADLGSPSQKAKDGQMFVDGQPGSSTAEKS